MKLTQDASVSYRNQSMECVKLLASFFMVFLHVPFPGTMGKVVCCLARFAVPLFFAISGYFSYQATPKKLIHRLKHILWLNLLAVSIALAWNCFRAITSGGSISGFLRDSLPTASQWLQWFLLSVNPFAGHLWYLSAIFVCYLFFLGYCILLFRKSYRILYVLCGGALVLFFLLDEFSGIIGIQVPYPLYRNGWLLGLPMFSLGLFLREHQDILLRHCQTWLLLLLLTAGNLFVLLERLLFGPAEMHLGTLLALISLLLLTIVNPCLIEASRPGAAALSGCGFLSTVIYLSHLILSETYNLYLLPHFLPHLGYWEPYARPLIVCALSLLVAVFCQYISHLYHKHSRHP